MGFEENMLCAEVTSSHGEGNSDLNKQLETDL